MDVQIVYLHSITVYTKGDTASNHVTAGDESLLSGAEAKAYPGYGFLSKMQSSLAESLQLE